MRATVMRLPPPVMRAIRNTHAVGPRCETTRTVGVCATHLFPPEQYERPANRTYCSTSRRGATEGFSLEGLIGVHFLTRTA